MKNIHILQTEQPSRLVKSIYNDFILLNTNVPNWFETNLKTTKQNIYITSDEEIKDVRPHKGKWQLEKGSVLNKFPDYLTDLSECKLVIMTTDQDLIKDGVQSIDDEFLEWFIAKANDSGKPINQEDGQIREMKIIFIPSKEKPKLDITQTAKNKRNCHSVVVNEIPYFRNEDFKFNFEKNKWERDRLSWSIGDEKGEGPYVEPKGPLDGIGKYASEELEDMFKGVIIQEPKQETFEEVAERYYEDEVSINAFINGYKLAQEQNMNKYSEEEVLNFTQTTVFKTIEELIEENNSFITTIPNNMGINLVSVKGIEYDYQEDGQIKEMKIIFIPSKEELKQIRL